MASDSLISVIGGLIRRENRLAREEKAKLKAAEAEQAEAEEDEEDEDEDPVGEPADNQPPADEPPPEAEPAPGEPESEPDPEEDEEEEEPEEEPNPEGDTKPTGPDPTLVAQVAAIVKQEIEDEAEEKKESEIKLSGKKEKVNTKPKLEQEVRKGKMNFREAIRMAVTGTHLVEGYEQTVLDILEDEKIDGPLGYEPFFEKGKLYVEKGSEKKAAKVLKQAREVSKVPKIVGEVLQPEEYLAMEAVEVDGRCKGFKEALRRLTYEKIKALKAKEEAKKEEVEIDETIQVPEGLSKEGAAEFMAAASAAKREGKKKFKFGGKEYPVTIKVDIPAKKESVEEHKGTEPHKHPHEEDEVEESVELQAIMALDDAGIKADINRKGQVVVKKKDKKKAHKALEKGFPKGGWPTVRFEEVELDEASSKKARNKAADEIEAIADKGGAEAPTLFSLADKLRKGTHNTTGLKLSKPVTSILKKHGIKEEIKTRTAYEVVSEARNRAAKNKPEWEKD